MTLNWVSSNACHGVPPNAVEAGRDIDGDIIYVGRTHYRGDIIPAEWIPNKERAYVAYNGAAIEKHDCEILCGTDFSWVASQNGHVPPDAICAGTQSNGELLFVGRTHYSGNLTVGKIHPSHGCIYVPFGGKEHSERQYEVLVKKGHVFGYVILSKY